MIEATNKFIDYLVDRTELVIEKDDNQFDFAHKTFNEYFLALYFAKDLSNAELMGKLDNYICQYILFICTIVADCIIIKLKQEILLIFEVDKDGYKDN